MNLDLRTLLGIARRWWLLLLLAPLITAATAFVSASRQQEMYSASSTLLISQSDPTQQDLSGLQAGERLGATYERLVDTDPVLQAAITRLGLPLTVGELRESVSASAVTGTQLLRVTVVDTDPEQAARIADTVAQEFTTVITQRSAQLSSGSREALQTQITMTESQIAELTRQIGEIEGSANAETLDGQSRLATLRTSLTQQQVAYGNLLTQQQQLDISEAAIQSRVTVWEPARIPESPFAPRTTLYVALALVAGLIIAVAAIFLIEYLDNTVKSSDDVTRLTELPVLAEVRSIPRLQPGRDQLFVLNQPASSPSESVRLLRANLEFASATKEISTLLVSSAGPGEGKSTITANLAVALANAGLVTVIIDADLRRPTQHRIFDLPNARGLTSLLTHPEEPWAWAAAEVIPQRLFVIPSGPQPPNPTDLLGTPRFRQLIDELRTSVDLVLLDSPPILAATDPLVLAPMTDGLILLCRAGQTRLDALQRAVATVRQDSIRVLGVVVNDIQNRNDAGYYYGDYYGATPTAVSAPMGAVGTPTSGH